MHTRRASFVVATALVLSACGIATPAATTVHTDSGSPTIITPIQPALIPTNTPRPTASSQPPLIISAETLPRLSPIATWQGPETVNLAWSPESDWFRAGDYEDAFRYPVPGGTPQPIPPITYGTRSPRSCPAGWVTAQDMSLDARKTAIGTEIEGGRGIPTISAVGVWDTLSQTCIIAFPRLEGDIWQLSLSEDGTWLLVSTNYNDTYLFNTQTATHTCSFVGNIAIFSPIENVFALHSFGDNVVTLWDPETCTKVASLWGIEDVPEEEVTTLYPGAIAFSHDGRLLAVSPCFSSGYLRFWSVDDVDPIQTIWHPDGAICKVSFSPDGRYMASNVTDPASSYERGDTIALWAVAP